MTKGLEANFAYVDRFGLIDGLRVCPWRVLGFCDDSLAFLFHRFCITRTPLLRFVVDLLWARALAELLWICCTAGCKTNPRQLEVMESGSKPSQIRRPNVCPWYHGNRQQCQQLDGCFCLLSDEIRTTAGPCIVAECGLLVPSGVHTKEELVPI